MFVAPFVNSEPGTRLSIHSLTSEDGRRLPSKRNQEYFSYYDGVCLFVVVVIVVVVIVFPLSSYSTLYTQIIALVMTRHTLFKGILCRTTL